MTMTMTNAATIRQTNFINVLLKERQVSEQTRTDITEHLNTGMTSKYASSVIDYLLKQPKAIAAGILAAEKTGGPLQKALALVPKSKYAIRVEDIDMVLNKTPIHGDMLFIEIREYRGNLFMRRLTGSVGGFTRWHVQAEDAITIVNTIAKDPYKYTKLFGEHYSCCGSCGAELTDPVSREFQLGPECRKKFGK